jgi:hypothetical protein
LCALGRARGCFTAVHSDDRYLVKLEAAVLEDMIAIILVIFALLLLGASTFYWLGCRALHVAQKQIDARVEEIPERETVRKKAT